MNIEEAYRNLWKGKMPHQVPEQQSPPDRVRWTVDLFPVLPPGSLLVDLGTGSGSMLHQAGKRQWRAIGFDIDAALVAWLNACGFTAHQADLSSAALPVGEESADVVTSCDVIEHLVDPYHMVAEAYRILKPGGFFYVGTPNMSHWRRVLRLIQGHHPRSSGDQMLRDGCHLGYYGALDLFDILRQAGFRDTQTVLRSVDTPEKETERLLVALGGNKKAIGYSYSMCMGMK